MKKHGGKKMAALIQPGASSMAKGLEAPARRPTSADPGSIRFERASYFKTSASSGGYAIHGDKKGALQPGGWILGSIFL